MPSATVEGFAQPLENGARVAGLGGAGAALADHFSVRLNPAAFYHTRSVFLTSGYTRAYGIPELDHYHAVVGTRTGTIGLSAAIESFGFDSFRLQSLHAAVARHVPNGRLSFGMTMTADRQAIREGANSTTVGMSVGVIASIADPVRLGVAMRRLVMISDPSSLGRLVVAGVAIRIAPTVLVLADVHKDAAFDASVRAGIEARPVSALTLRAGVSTFPESVSLGVGITAGSLRLDVAAQRHYLLGWSKAVAIWFGK